MGSDIRSKTAVGLMTAAGERTSRLKVTPGRPFNVSLTGTFAGTVSLLRKVPQGIGPLDSGVHSGADNAAALTQAAAGWTTNELIGKYIFNETDGSLAPITANTATVVTGTLDGGTGDEYDIGDAWSLWEVMATVTAIANPQPTYTEAEDGVEYMLAFTLFTSGDCYGRIGQSIE